MAQQSTDNPAPNPVSPIFIPDYWNLTSPISTTTTTSTTPDTPGIVGEIIIVARTTLPSADWLWCDGRTYLATSYPDLFTAIGYNYGGSAGSFIVPYIIGAPPANQGRMLIGADNPSTLLTMYQGSNQRGGGRRDITINSLVSHNHGASHTHDFSYSWSYPTIATAITQSLSPGPAIPQNPYVTTITAGTGNGNTTGTVINSNSPDTSYVGSGDQFLPPFTILNYCIRWKA